MTDNDSTFGPVQLADRSDVHAAYRTFGPDVLACPRCASEGANLRPEKRRLRTATFSIFSSDLIPASSGFAGPEWINGTTGEIVEGLAFMNGGALLGPRAFPVAEMLAVQVHEFGHYQKSARDGKRDRARFAR